MARRPLRIEQPRYRVHVRRPRRQDYTVACFSLDECLDVIRGEREDRVAGSELTLESRVGGRYRPRMLWRFVASRSGGRWSREALAA
jgi:hypothetical protein